VLGVVGREPAEDGVAGPEAEREEAGGEGVGVALYFIEGP